MDGEGGIVFQLFGVRKFSTKMDERDTAAIDDPKGINTVRDEGFMRAKQLKNFQLASAPPQTANMQSLF